METFQQPKLTGYRQLNADEAAMMNEVKEWGARFEALVERVRGHVAYQQAEAKEQPTATEVHRLRNAEPERWAAMARTDAQVAVMKLCRAIAQPAS